MAVEAVEVVEEVAVEAAAVEVVALVDDLGVAIATTKATTIEVAAVGLLLQGLVHQTQPPVAGDSTVLVLRRR